MELINIFKRKSIKYNKHNNNDNIDNIDNEIDKVLDSDSEYNLSGDLYKKNDMSKFIIDRLNWKIDKRNIYNIYKIDDYNWLSEMIESDIKFFYSFVNENDITLPKVKYTSLPKKYLDNSYPIYQFNPFTPTGRIAKNTYKINFNTLTLSEEILNMSEAEFDIHNKKSNEGLTIFGVLTLDYEQNPIKVVYRFFDKEKNWIYKIDIRYKSGKRLIKEIVKSNFPTTDDIHKEEVKEILYISK